MKHAYSFLAGVALVSLCVLFANSLPGYMFGLGLCVGLSSWSIIRLALHWGSSALKLRRVPSNSAELLVKVPVSRSDRMDPDSRFLKRSAGATLVSQKEKPGSQSRRNESSPRRYSSAAQKRDRSVVQSSNVLPVVQQEVLSALINLRVPFADAESAVTSVAKDGQSFDELFRACMSALNAGKSRRVA
jgi:hypothetical protein